MIGFLSGKPLLTSLSTLIVVNGVGYAVHVTSSTKSSLVGKEQAELYIHAHIKEDCFDLYGFLTEVEKQMFLLLLSVDGVGPRTALAVMDRGAQAIVTAVREADVSFFQAVPRVGKKSAQKIIIELKAKLGGQEDLDLVEPVGKEKEVVEALISLGFSENESRKVSKTLELDDMRIEDAVKTCIQLLTNKKA